MSEASPNKNGDIFIGIDPAEKTGGDTVSFAHVKSGRQFGKSILFSLMYSVKGRHKIYGPDCLVCGKIQFTHSTMGELIDDHPYCGDNLDYLTWKYESKKLLK